jgi:hypothetical protein
MKLTTIAGALAAAVIAASAIVSPSLAAGEPKSVPPFTLGIGAHGVPVLTGTVDEVAGARPIRGEPKNERPFTDPAGDPGLARALERVDELMVAPEALERSRTRTIERGSWAEAVLGALAISGIFLAGFGAAAVRRQLFAGKSQPNGGAQF